MYFYVPLRCLLVCLFLTVVVTHSQDLFDMFGDFKDQVAEKVDYASAKVKEKVRKHVFDLKDSGTCSATHTEEYQTVLTAYRQLIGDWMEKFPSTDGGEYRFLLTLSPSDLKRLKKFSTSASFEQKDLSEVHAISELLKRGVYRIEEDKPDFSSLTWSAWLRSFDINGIIKYIFILIVIGTLSFISIRTHLRRGRWFTTFFIVAFITSVIQNWYKLYQEAQAKIDEVLMKKLPKHCQGQSMGVWDMVKSKLGRFVQLPSNECLEYHKALRASPHAQVTPVQAISMTVAQLFTTPLGEIGEAISKFFAGALLHVPVVLWPVVILSILFIVAFLILMRSGYEVRLPFMMGSLRPSPHAAVAAPTQVIEQIENPSNQVQQLQNTVQQLQLELQEKTLRLEHNSTATVRASRSSSIGRIDQQRERSSSIRRVNADALAENQYRQRTTTADIGFRKDFVSE